MATQSMGQVIFLNLVHYGRVVFASLAVVDPTLAALALLGTTTANTTSHLIGLDKNAWKNGLWGYIGALTGFRVSRVLQKKQLSDRERMY